MKNNNKNTHDRVNGTNKEIRNIDQLDPLEALAAVFPNIVIINYKRYKK